MPGTKNECNNLKKARNYPILNVLFGCLVIGSSFFVGPAAYVLFIFQGIVNLKSLFFDFLQQLEFRQKLQLLSDEEQKNLKIESRFKRNIFIWGSLYFIALFVGLAGMMTTALVAIPAFSIFKDFSLCLFLGAWSGYAVLNVAEFWDRYSDLKEHGAWGQAKEFWSKTKLFFQELGFPLSKSLFSIGVVLVAAKYLPVVGSLVGVLCASNAWVLGVAVLATASILGIVAWSGGWEKLKEECRDFHNEICSHWFYKRSTEYYERGKQVVCVTRDIYESMRIARESVQNYFSPSDQAEMPAGSIDAKEESASKFFYGDSSSFSVLSSITSFFFPSASSSQDESLESPQLETKNP